MSIIIVPRRVSIVKRHYLRLKKFANALSCQLRCIRDCFHLNAKKCLSIIKQLKTSSAEFLEKKNLFRDFISLKSFEVLKVLFVLRPSSSEFFKFYFSDKKSINTKRNEKKYPNQIVKLWELALFTCSTIGSQTDGKDQKRKENEKDRKTKRLKRRQCCLNVFSKKCRRLDCSKIVFFLFACLRHFENMQSQKHPFWFYFFFQFICCCCNLKRPVLRFFPLSDVNIIGLIWMQK